MNAFRICTGKHLFYLMVMGILCFFVFSGCGGGKKVSSQSPLDALKASVGNAKDYSIILEDMKSEGNFVKTYFHRYRLIADGKAKVTDWMEVPKDFFEKNRQFLGMVLAGRVNGETIDAPEPPGYRYVGNPQYGQWVRDATGNSVWAFNNQYSYMPGLYGGWFMPVIELDFDDFWKHKKKYKRYKSSKTYKPMPYFGRTKQYGTTGTVVKKAKPDFYSRYQARSQVKKASFAQKVNQRIGRTRTGLRSRAGGRGK